MASRPQDLAGKAGRSAARKIARPAAAFLLRRNPFALAALMLGPAAMEFGKAAIAGYRETRVDLDHDAIEGTVLRDVRTPHPPA